jgi:hypothetical protein
LETALVDEVVMGPLQGPNAVLPASGVLLSGNPFTETNHLQQEGE